MKSGILAISEAGSLALHTMAVLAKNQKRLVSTEKLAKALSASPHHLSKVLQRLVKYGLVEAVSGPSGGHRLAKPADKITLLEIYEILEGKFKNKNCLFSKPICDGRNCILGGLLKEINQRTGDYLANTHLSDLVNSFPRRLG